MSRPLPYPGHSWSLTQHAVGNDPATLYNFLKCAAPFEGQNEGYDEKITALMMAMGVLTANIRGTTPDAWRDYQQILAELGLIYSTKIVPVLTLTELGQMFLAGEIGFAELIGAQCLRYQYPNGQKSTIQSRLREALAGASFSVPQTLTELQVDRGVLLKPAVLILRVLLELQGSGHAPELTIIECRTSLIPCKTNQDWPLAVAEIVAKRGAGGVANGTVNRHSQRNLQDWFKLLNKSDIFDSDGSSGIRLSAYAQANIELMRSLCHHEEEAASFWIPPGYDTASRRTWFHWYGHLPYGAQAVIRTDVVEDEEYVSKNYVGGIEDDEPELAYTGNIALNLQQVDLTHLGRDSAFSFSGDIAALMESLRSGAEKRHAKTLLHDRIIKNLAESFLSQGATVKSDANSVDLLSTWPDGSSAIFEVKTVTRRSLQGRLRMAIGQVQEYAYRRQLAGDGLADKVIVVNTELKVDSWQTKFLTDHLSIGLICFSSGTRSSHSPPSAATQGYWT